MKARLKLIENVCLLGEADSGHGVVIDGAPEIGGHNLGVRPMEMVLIGLGGCTAMDVLSILKKQRQQVTVPAGDGVAINLQFSLLTH